MRRSTLTAILLLAAALLFSAFAKTGDAPKLDFAKVDPYKMLIDPYSYWSQPYSFYYFHHMDKIPHQRLDWIRRSGAKFDLKDPQAPFSLSYSVNGKTATLDEYLEQADVLGFLVLKDNQVVYEKYLHGATPQDRFLSMSVEKSIVSVLFGTAVDEGKINVNDPVTKYLPALAGSAYKDCTVKNLLQMASDVNFNEDYLDPKADVHHFLFDLIRGGEPFQQVAAKMGSERAPGTQFHYQSINTQVLGEILEKATGTRLNKYAEDRLWSKIGAQSDAFIYESDKQPEECAFGCFNATLRDYARFGLMAMHSGELDGKRVVSEAWMREATTPPSFNVPHIDQKTGRAVTGYGYQWWLLPGPDHAFQAVGIYGQNIYVNPAKHVVIAQFSALPKPSGGGSRAIGRPHDAIAAKLSQ
jgi:CubicO group peptidase (beta-lactamase class C family)